MLSYRLGVSIPFAVTCGTHETDCHLPTVRVVRVAQHPRSVRLLSEMSADTSPVEEGNPEHKGMWNGRVKRCKGTLKYQLHPKG